MNNSFNERGGAWVIGQSILMLAVFTLAVAFPGRWHHLAVMVAGVLFLFIGGGIGLAGVMALETNRTPFPAPLKGSRLVQDGIYRLIRHPLYASVMLTSLGWALLWQSGRALLAVLALVVFFHAKVRHEERRLREVFPDYAAYEKRVKRFLPWVY